MKYLIWRRGSVWCLKEDRRQTAERLLICDWFCYRGQIWVQLFQGVSSLMLAAVLIWVPGMTLALSTLPSADLTASSPWWVLHQPTSVLISTGCPLCSTHLFIWLITLVSGWRPQMSSSVHSPSLCLMTVYKTNNFTIIRGNKEQIDGPWRYCELNTAWI